jgi:hypothetical protein
MKDTIWTCRDGRQVLVSQMEYQHLMNCIRMIGRKRSWRREYLPRLLLELEIRRIQGRQ